MTPSDRIGGSNRNKWTARPARPRAIGMVCAVATAGALLAGCGGAKSDSGTEKEGAAPASPARAASPSGSMSPGASTSPSSSSSSLTEDQAQRKALVPKIKYPYDKAIDAALKAAPGTKAVSLDIEEGDNGGDPVWEVKVAKSDGSASTVRVDAVSGKAQKPKTESDESADDKSELASRLKSATVTAQQAAQTALGKKKGTVTSIDLEGAENSSASPSGSASPSSAAPGSASPSSAAPGSASPGSGTENGRNGSGKAQWSVDVVTSGDWNKTTFDIDAADKKVLGEKVDKD